MSTPGVADGSRIGVHPVKGRVRSGLLRRVVIGLSAVVAYAIVAFIASGVFPDGWPAIGDAGYSDAQATIVPALNIFGLGVLALCVFGPLVSAGLRVVFVFVLAVVAAVAGPLLAVIDGATAFRGIAGFGAVTLAIAGIAIGVAGALLVGAGGRSRFPSTRSMG